MLSETASTATYLYLCPSRAPEGFPTSYSTQCLIVALGALCSYTHILYGSKVHGVDRCLHPNGLKTGARGLVSRQPAVLQQEIACLHSSTVQRIDPGPAKILNPPVVPGLTDQQCSRGSSGLHKFYHSSPAATRCTQPKIAIKSNHGYDPVS